MHRINIKRIWIILGLIIKEMCGGASALKMLFSRTAAASLSMLFAHFRIQTIHLSHGAVVGRTRRNNIDFVRIGLYWEQKIVDDADVFCLVVFHMKMENHVRGQKMHQESKSSMQPVSCVLSFSSNACSFA